MKKAKLNEHASAQAHIEFHEDGRIVLVSYKTPVCVITPDGWFHCSGLYSMTTRKHIGWFMKQFGMSYNIAKFTYEKNADYNIHTGEVIIVE